MSRFAVVYEDPAYDESEEADWEDMDIMDWLDRQIDVVEKPQEEYSPYSTVNS